MPYTFLEDLTIADVAFEATGKTLEELFASAGEAVTATMVKDLTTVRQDVQKKISLHSSSAEMLLFDFLQELVYLKDAELLLFSRFDVRIDDTNGDYTLTATLFGDMLDQKRQEHLVDVKAVTMHRFELAKTR